MGIFNPNELAEATARSTSLQRWSNVFGGLAVSAFIFAAFKDWHGVLITIGIVLVVCWFGMRVRASSSLHNAVSEAAVEAAMPFDVEFDQSWIPVVRSVFQEAREESRRTGQSLDHTYQATFVALLIERGYSRRF